MKMTIDIEETQDHLPELVNLALQGEEIIIARDEKPMARIVAVAKDEPVSESPRTPCLSRGAVKWISLDFDAPHFDDHETSCRSRSN